jgi:hypothetical protein
MFPHLSKFNLQQWIEENRGNWGRRRTVWKDSDFITVVHRGPNRGNNSTSTKAMKFSISSKASSISTTSIPRTSAKCWCLSRARCFCSPPTSRTRRAGKKGHGLWSSNASAGLTKSIGGFGFVKGATTSSTRRRRDPAKDPAIKQISQSKTPTSDSEPTSLLAPANAAKSRTSQRGPALTFLNGYRIRQGELNGLKV